MNSRIKAVIFWLVIMVSAFLLWQVVRGTPNQQATPEISYSEFLSQVEAGNVVKVTISKNQVYGRSHDNSSFRVVAPTNQEGMLLSLRQKNVEIWFRDTASADRSTWLLNLAPLVLLAALWFFMIRQMRSRQVQQQADGTAQTTETRWPSR